ncbi:hypothetical protein CAEBREN_23800 [Caenorhabditis brenneri]|uniref:Uncharacterized protein n=1 Tax=Caenorhabditis brenneri TaxID=135651 RepID=G0NTL9_CAEBE|nr:hypothetical protein CAEBREN_23800 [Caenorhabditis brenneri]
MDDDKPFIENLKIVLIEYVKTAIFLNQALAITTIFILAIPVFPVFVIISRANSKDDRKTSIYPIISYLYKGTIFTYSVFFFMGTISFISSIWYINESIITIGHSAHILLETYVTTHHWLLSLLVLQRFLLYYFPNIERFVNLTERATIRVLILMYSAFYTKIIVFLLVSCQDGACSLEGSNDLFFKLMTVC